MPAGGNEVFEPQQQEMRPQTYTIQIWTYEHSDNIQENEFKPVGPDMMRNSSVVQVKVGDTIKWRNDNRGIEHTVTSGENRTPDGRFDSGVISYTEEFKHTFTEAGEYPYFCILHPNMVGSVSVGQFLLIC
jgi:plastocyanin